MPRRSRDSLGPAADRLTLRLTGAEMQALRAYGRGRAVAPLVRDALAALGLLRGPTCARGRAVLVRRGRGWGVRVLRRSEGAVLFSRAVLGRQVEAARAIERDQATVSRWASGRSTPSGYVDRRRVERLFGVPAEAWERPWTPAAAPAA